MKTVIECKDSDPRNASIKIGDNKDISLGNVSALDISLEPGKLNEVVLRLAAVDLDMEGELFVIDRDGNRQAVDHIQLANGVKLY